MNRPFTVQPVLNGWIIEIGCQKAVFKDAEVMAGEIRRYLLNPDEVEKEYVEKSRVNSVPEVARPLNRIPEEYANAQCVGTGQPATTRY